MLGSETPQTMLNDLVQGFRSLVQADLSQWNFQDRRKLVRLKCHYDLQAETCATSASTEPFRAFQAFEATVLDIGGLGLRIRSKHPLERGNTVRLFSPFRDQEVQPVDCQVVWAKPPDDEAAILAGTLYSLDTDATRASWVSYFLDELGFRIDKIHSNSRFSQQNLAGKLWLGERGPGEIQVLNLGVLGALVKVLRGRLKVGDNVRMLIGPQGDLPLLTACGDVVQVDHDGPGCVCGVEFKDMQSSDVLVLGEYLRSLLTGLLPP